MDHELSQQEKFEKWTRQSIVEIQAVISKMAKQFDFEISLLKSQNVGRKTIKPRKVKGA